MGLNILALLGIILYFAKSSIGWATRGLMIFSAVWPWVMRFIWELIKLENKTPVALLNTLLDIIGVNMKKLGSAF